MTLSPYVFITLSPSIIYHICKVQYTLQPRSTPYMFLPHTLPHFCTSQHIIPHHTTSQASYAHTSSFPLTHSLMYAHHTLTHYTAMLCSCMACNMYTQTVTMPITTTTTLMATTPTTMRKQICSLMEDMTTPTLMTATAIAPPRRGMAPSKVLKRITNHLLSRNTAPLLNPVMSTSRQPICT